MKNCAFIRSGNQEFWLKMEEVPTMSNQFMIGHKRYSLPDGIVFDSVEEITIIAGTVNTAYIIHYNEAKERLKTWVCIKGTMSDNLFFLEKIGGLDKNE